MACVISTSLARSDAIQRCGGRQCRIEHGTHVASSSKPGRGIANVRKIGRARARAEMSEQRIVALVGLLPVDRRVLLLKVAEGDRAGRAGALAGGLDLVRSDRPVLAFGGAPRAADALDAIGAFLHDAARAHRDFRILLRPVGFEAEIGVFLAVGVAEEVEAPHLVGAIRFAESRADAAIVDLHVEPFAVMHRGRDRTDRLAGRVLAMHAGHRLEARLRLRRRCRDRRHRRAASACRGRGRLLPGRPRARCSPTWQATTQALQPMQTEASITIAQAWPSSGRGRSGIRLGSGVCAGGARLAQAGEVAQRIEFAHIFRRAHHVLGGQDLLPPAGLGDRRFRDRPEVCRPCGSR